MAGTAIAALALACGMACEGGDDTHLSFGGEAPSFDDDALRRRMNVRAYAEEVGWVEIDPDAFRRGLAADCLYVAQHPTSATWSAPTGDCVKAIEDINVDTCRMHGLLLIAESPMETTVSFDRTTAGLTAPLAGTGMISLTVPPQEPAAAAALADLAYQMAVQGSMTADGAFADCTPLDTVLATVQPDGVSPGGGSHTRGAFLASSLAEFHHVGLHATELSAQLAMAVSDAYHSEFPDHREATWAALQSSFANRTWSARRTIAPSGLASSTLPGVFVWFDADAGFCPSARLSAEAAEAERLLRLSGISPFILLLERVDDMPELEVSMQSLMEGFEIAELGMTEEDSVRARLSVLLRQSELADASAEDIYAHFGVTEQAFMDARHRIAQETTAFHRSLTVEGGDPIVVAESELPVYAATRNPPRLPDPVFWSVAARFQASPAAYAGPTEMDGSPADQEPAEPINGTTVENVATFLDWWNTRVAELATSVASGSAATSEMLARMASTNVTERAGRVRACWYGNGGTPPTAMSGDLVRFDVYGEFGPLYVVRGHEGLQCATRGDVEGAPCDLDDYLLSINSGAGFSTRTPSATSGFSTAQRGSMPAHLGYFEFPSFVDDTVNVYIVEGTTGEPVAPGRLRAVSGFLMPRPTGATPSWRYCLTAPVVPDLDDRVATLLAPDPTYCNQSADSCAGVPYDQRIPLENELTSDGDGVESSWRHYLRLAQDAADRADALGESLIRTGLEMDQQIEAAAAQLEDICGVPISVSSIRALTATPATDGACSMGACADPLYTCRSGTCVLDVFAALEADGLSMPDAQRLRDCVGDSGSVEWAALGNRQLCLWMNAAGDICTGGDPGVDCPWFADGDGACDFSLAPPETMGLEHITVDTALSIFPAPDDESDGHEELDPTEYPCEHIARVRAGETSSRWNVWASPFLTQTQFSTLSRRLGWEPSAGDFSRVTWDGATVFSTGTTSGGPSSLWPCEETGPAGNPDSLCPNETLLTSDLSDSDVPLFCVHGVCGESDRVERARMNDMLARAVIAARVLGGQTLAGIRVPYYPRSRDDGVRVEGRPGWSTPRATPTGLTSQTSSTGSIGIDRGADEGVSWEAIDFDQLAAYAAIINGTSGTLGACRPTSGSAGIPLTTAIPAGAEWVACPYDQSACSEIFDDDPDCDDPSGTLTTDLRSEWDRDLPLLVRTLPDAVSGFDPNTGAAQFWLDTSTGDRAGLTSLVWNSLLHPGTAHEIVIRSSTGHFEPNGRFPLSDVTYYWRRSGCGHLGGANCDFNDGVGEGRTRGEEIEIANEASSCFRNGTEGACDSIGCNGWYNGCVSDVEGRDDLALDFRSTFDGNRAFIAPRGLTRRDILNGMELLCVAARGSNPDLNFGCSEPPPIGNIQQMLQASDFLDCKARGIREATAMTVVRGLPQRVVDLIEGGSSGSVGGVAGDYRSAVSRLRIAFIELRDTNIAIAGELAGMATEVRDLRNAVAQSAISSQIEDLTLASQIGDRLTSCAVAIGDAVAASGSSPSGAVGKYAAAGASCVNSAIQIAIASQISDLRHQGIEAGTEAAFITFESRYNERARNLSRLVSEIQAKLEAIDAALADLETLQRRGQRALAGALFLDSDESGRHFATNSVMRARYDTDLARYTEAHRRAVRLAYIAKIALEQRLGMPLDSMTEDLLTVEAPARWQSTICSMPPIDYDAISRPPSMLTDPDAGPSGTEETARPPGYSGSYVGDYVRRLEQVFESYNFRYPFVEGTDTAVFSIRDDIHAIRASCGVEVPNRLYYAGALDVSAPGDGIGWTDEGCDDLSDWPSTAPDLPPSCIRPTPLGADDEMSTSVIGPSSPDFGRVSGYRVEFGLPDDDERRRSAEDDPEVAINAGTRRIQWIRLEPGQYRVSWAVPSLINVSKDPADIDPDDVITVVDESDTELFIDSSASPHPAAPGEDAWPRFFRYFDVPTERWVGVAITPAFGTGGPRYRRAILGAVMVERLPRDAYEGVPPGPFFDTGAERTRPLEVCEDVHGVMFRARSWARRCVPQCPDGYDGTCPPELAHSRCFYETTFSVSSDWLQDRLTGTPAGFASGNFNYRIESVALNLVGTGLRDCTSAGSTGSTCYSSGSLGFSILHDGPYLVRNHRGQLYEAPLFFGRIESARALMAERYITNPISSADRALVEPYMRAEFRGRPLGGSFAVRIWDDEGFQYDRLEDVQLVLQYRYWTRQE